MFVYYCCKLLDFCDTLFMVLGKKTRQYTLLHVWHHASIVPLFGYYLSTGMGGGFISALPVWNSLVHVIMYSHYLITSLFTFKRMWWKPIITASQMGHHVLIMMYMILNRVYVSTESHAAAPAAAAARACCIATHRAVRESSRRHRPLRSSFCSDRRKIRSARGRSASTLCCGDSRSLGCLRISSCSHTSRNRKERRVRVADGGREQLASGGSFVFEWSHSTRQGYVVLVSAHCAPHPPW